MNHWLLKSEPSDYSIDDLQREKITLWTGIRNFQARNFIRDEMRLGDRVFIYHSSCKQVGIAGIAEVVSQAYADPDQFDNSSRYYDVKASREKPNWFVIDIKFVAKAQQLLSLKVMKAAPELADLKLFKQSRLSVLPVSTQQWDYILAQLAVIPSIS